MLVAVVFAAGVLALWLLPIILGRGALSIAYCLLPEENRLTRGVFRGGPNGQIRPGPIPENNAAPDSYEVDLSIQHGSAAATAGMRQCRTSCPSVVRGLIYEHRGSRLSSLVFAAHEP